MNVYQMYVASKDNPDGVWIQRTTWSNMCARIKAVGEFKGPEPYFGNPEVRADLYSLSGELRQTNAVIPVPGTYKTWRQIPTPIWWSAK
jgi:hypothetical protein